MALSWEYIAGFFDGEGHIGMSCGSGRTRSGSTNLTFTQAGPQARSLLLDIQGALESVGVKSKIYAVPKKKREHLQGYRLYTTGLLGTVKALKIMLPFLYIKKTVAQDIIRYATLWPNPRFSPLCSKWRRELQLGKPKKQVTNLHS